MARPKAARTEDATLIGFVACSTMGMVRRRDGRVFMPTRHFYEGEPTETMLADPCLRIELNQFGGQAPRIEDGIEQEKQKEAAARMRLQGLPSATMKEVE